MKSILVFTLPEEQEDMKMAHRACEYYCIIEDVKNYARGLRKYDDRDNVPKEEIIEKLYELIDGYENQ